MGSSNAPRNTDWCWSDLVREHGEEGAFVMLAKMPGVGQYVANVAYGGPSEDPRPTYRTYVDSHTLHTPIDWQMPWDAWSVLGVMSDRPTFPDGIWLTERTPLADRKRNWR